MQWYCQGTKLHLQHLKPSINWFGFPARGVSPAELRHVLGHDSEQERVRERLSARCCVIIVER